MASVQKRPKGRWRGRYRDDAGKEHARHFDRKTDAQRWLDEQTAKLVSGTHVTPRTARTTVGKWCDIWLEGYKTRRKSTVRQAEVRIARIREAFGPMQLSDVRPPSHVRTWTAQLAAEGSQSRTSTLSMHVWRNCSLMLSMTASWRSRRVAADVARSRQAAGLCSDDRAGLGAVRRYA